MSGWSEERVELLKKLWNEGLSASQIASRLGNFSHTADRGRSAVIGKVHRLKLSGRVTPQRNSRPSPPRRRRVKLPIAPTVTRAVAMPTFKAEPIIETEELLIPLDQRKGVLDLKDRDCRWPIGDPQQPDFHFCGHAKHEGLPYCEFHARKAYVVPERMRQSPTYHLQPIAKVFKVA